MVAATLTVELLLRVADHSVKTEGKVQLMDPELGMGIEFRTRTPEHRQRLQEIIQLMAASPDAISEVLVEPEGMDWNENGAPTSGTTMSSLEEPEPDPLLELFRTGAALTKGQFLLELEKYQLAVSPAEASELNLAEPIAYQRREPRLAVSVPVQVLAQDRQPSNHTTHLVDVSHRGARLEGVVFQLKPGAIVNLVSDGCDARFLVIWVGKPGTPQEGQIGLQSLTKDA